MNSETSSKSILIPAPSEWPFFAALGILLIFFGLVTHFIVSLMGVAVLLRAAVGWWFDVLPEQREQAVDVESAVVSIAKSRLRVDHLTLGTAITGCGYQSKCIRIGPGLLVEPPVLWLWQRLPCSSD